MKKTKFIIVFFFCYFHQLYAQDVVSSFYYTDGYSIIPKSVNQFADCIVIPFSITKNSEKKAGIMFLNNDNSIKDVILFEGEDDYVINQIIEAEDGNILVSTEGYSQSGQESLYFMELSNNNIINEFVFNEGGNELDPFTILEVENNIIIGGFVKSRELVSNSFYNMYSETQLIYVAEFSKKGKKIWSKGINLEGYEKGICNNMIKVDDGIILLCHANKIGEKMAPILVKIDKAGSVLDIIELYNREAIIIGSTIRKTNKGIELTGSYSTKNKHCVFNTWFSDNLNIIKSAEYNIPYRLTINGITKDGKIYGAVLYEGGGYNNAIINFSDTRTSLWEFGSQKSDLLVGITNNTLFSYTIGASPEHTSTLNFITDNYLMSDVTTLNEVNSFLKTNTDFSIKYESDFIKISINKGVRKLRVKNARNNLKQ